ncbi:MAG: HD domain-containing phosphohydrolase [Candidatus Electrothrix sp. YB6]
MKTAREPWKVLVVDDDEGVQTLTQLILKRMTFSGRSLQLLSAFSAKEAREILQHEKDIAVALIDVVMESEHAGLELVEYIREELRNQYIRLIIRTGQSGSAPEREVIDHYDIDDYKDKTDLTAQKLYTTMRTALKAYRDIMTIERNRRGLERILSATPGLYLPNFASIDEFFRGVLMQITSLCKLEKNGLLCTINGFISTFDNKDARIRASTDDFQCQHRCQHGEEEKLPQTAPDDTIRICSRIVLEGREPGPGELPEEALLLPLGSPGNQPMGFVYLENTRPLTDNDRHLIQILVNQSTSALENLKLHFDLKEANRESLYMLAVAAEFKDQETGEHIRRMVHYTRLLALELGFSEEEATEMGQASMLHDIGKLGVPDAILQKQGRLTEEEFDIIRHHTATGARILGRHHWFQLAKEIALNHHEHWDGCGYPRGLKGEEIPLAARIVSVVDVFDALSHQRPYKKAWPIEDCIAALKKDSGTQFDPRVVDAFLRLLEREGKIIDSADSIDSAAPEISDIPAPDRE